MIIEKVQTLPPIIPQHFCAALLSSPAPNLRDWSGTFDVMWQEVLKMWKKVEKNPQKKRKCEALKSEIMELCERAKIKEKEREGQTDHKTQGFMYHVAIPSGLAEDIYTRLRFGRKGGSFRHRLGNNDPIQKIRRKRRK
jgi:hypothetical protein